MDKKSHLRIHESICVVSNTLPVAPCDIAKHITMATENEIESVHQAQYLGPSASFSCVVISLLHSVIQWSCFLLKITHHTFVLPPMEMSTANTMLFYFWFNVGLIIVGLMLTHRLRRWSSIKPTLCERTVLTGIVLAIVAPIHMVL